MDLTRIIHEKMTDGRLMFVYRGDITEKNSFLLLTLLENEMKDDSYSLMGRKRLFMFTLENLQNITLHGNHGRYAGMSMVIYSRTGDGYTITTGNIIENRKVDDLRTRIDNIRRLDPEEIKVQYKHILATRGFSEEGGAGLGLMEMAIKTGNRLDFDFIPVDKEYSYFILSKTVDATGMGVSSGEVERSFHNESIISLGKMMAENMIYLLWSGHISADTGEDVLYLAETRLAEVGGGASLRKRVFSIMVEIFENVSKYNPGREPEKKYGNPLAIIRIEDNRFILTTGNLVSNTMVNSLKDKLELINSKDKAGLKELYYKSLSDQTIEKESTGNLGLITIARKSGDRLDYSFKQVNDLYTYYMLTVRIATDMQD